MSLPKEDSLQKMTKQELIVLLKNSKQYWINFSSREYYETIDLKEEIEKEKAKSKKFEALEDWYNHQKIIKTDFETKLDILKQESKKTKKNEV